MIQVNRYAKLKDLKHKLTEKFWLEPDKIDLLTKGQFLKGDDRLLKELHVANNQTLMILEKNLEGEQWASDTHNQNITMLKDIFGEIEEALLIFTLKETNDKIEEAVELLSDEAKREELLKKFKRSSVDVEKTFVKETFRSLFIEKFSALEFYKLVFKLAGFKSSEIQTQALELIRLLKPNPQLLSNIEAYIAGLRDEIERLSKSKDVSSIYGQNHKQTTRADDDVLNFSLDDIVAHPTPLNVYKFEVFVKSIRLCFSKEEESKFDKKFELQNKFIENRGPEFLQLLYALLISDYRAKPNEDRLELLTMVSAVLSDYILASHLISSTDPYKKTKQVFFQRDKSLKKDSYMNITLRKNYSTDNVFSQNQNASFKTNKSPKSFATPGFQSPSKIIRHIEVPLVQISGP